VLRRQSKEADARAWESHYRSGHQRWRSSGVGSVVRRYLKNAPPGSTLLEIGCGVGDDAEDILDLGFTYEGIDLSRTAIARATAVLERRGGVFIAADFFKWHPSKQYAAVYDKGTFHNLSGPRRRQLFARLVAEALYDGGFWVTVCGAAEYPGTKSDHPAIFLTHLVEAVEPYFEVVNITKAMYGVQAPAHDFKAWFGLFRRWR
jgi:SAM-dependent methyltransferase